MAPLEQEKWLPLQFLRVRTNGRRSEYIQRHLITVCKIRVTQYIWSPFYLVTKKQHSANNVTPS